MKLFNKTDFGLFLYAIPSSVYCLSKIEGFLHGLVDLLIKPLTLLLAAIFLGGIECAQAAVAIDKREEITSLLRNIELGKAPGDSGFFVQHTLVDWEPSNRNATMPQRILYDTAGGAHTVAMLGVPNLVTAMHVGPTLIVVDAIEARWRLGDRFHWGFYVDAKRYHRPLAFKRLGDAPPPEISVDVASFADEMFSHMEGVAKWDPISRTLVQDGRGKAYACIRLRSPHDARILECEWSCVRGESEGQYVFDTACPCACGLPCYRMRKCDLNVIRDELSMVPFPEWQKLATIKYGAIPSGIYPVTSQAWQSLFRWRDALMPGIDGPPDLFSGEVIRRCKQLVERKYDRVAGEITPYDTSVDVERCTELVHQVLDRTYAHCEEFNPLHIDDPSMRWLLAEREVGSERMHSAYAYYLLPIARTLPMAPGVRAELFEAVASCGFPSMCPWRYPLQDAEHGLFMDAILRARVQYPCEPKHVQACVEATDLDAASAMVAVHTLALLDRLDLVPEDKQLLWLEQYVVDPPRLRRIRNLSEISRHTSGREALRQQLERNWFPEQVVADVSRVLAARDEGGR